MEYPVVDFVVVVVAVVVVVVVNTHRVDWPLHLHKYERRIGSTIVQKWDS